MRLSSRNFVASGLADILLAGSWDEGEFAERAIAALNQNHHWIKPLAARLFRHFGDRPRRPRHSEIIKFILNDRSYSRAFTASVKPRIKRYLLVSPLMWEPTGKLAECDFPNLATPGDLANWLGITVSELEWYADIRQMIRITNGPLCHYRYKLVAKRHDGYRLIEIPKTRLRAIQTRILREILNNIPPHPAAHGFRRGHSCLTYVTPHVGKCVVIRMDLRNFFASVPASRINGLFGTLGYPEATARYLTGLCTNSIPGRAAFEIPDLTSDIEISWQERKAFGVPHLPQGAPTSPALANLCALRFDYRLAALAKSIGANYTRYADDIAISGGDSVRRQADDISLLVAAIALEEGFEINYRKTRIMHKSDRQMLTGIIVNEKTNVSRTEYDQLKAILYNCHRSSPDEQNRDRHSDFRAHLLGRINYVRSLHPSRGEKLQALFDRIEW